MLVVILLLSLPVAAGSPEKAQQAFSEGQALLANADFDGALKAFKKASKADSANAEYGQQYAMLRQIVSLRKQLPKEKNKEKWLESAAALHTYYHEQGLFVQSLPVDQERLRRTASGEAALLLLQTQLALGMNSEAIEVIVGLPTDEQSAHVRTLHGLALAREGRMEEARSMVANASTLDASAGPRCFFDLAGLCALVGDSQGALRALKRSIELTPPSQIDAFKSRIGRSPDMASLVPTSEFAEVMKTSSTVQESPCSGGSGCSKCPQRAKCGSTKPAEAPDKR